MKMSFILGLIFSTFITLANASDFKKIPLTDFKTNTVIDLSTIDKTKPTYIKMWATWCQPCMEQMPHFQKTYEKYKNKINILAINININENTQYIDHVISQFGLTMPVLLDNEGQLAVVLGLVGTPYSVLINTDQNIVYTTHESDNILDTFIEKLAKGQKLESKSSATLTEHDKNLIIAPWQTGDHVLFFSATWCDWYLKDSRPEMAQDCQNIQSNIKQLQTQFKNAPWQGFVNHLWTDKTALADFTKLYSIEIPVDIDTSGVLFNHFNIRTVPTIIHIKNGKVIKIIAGQDISTTMIKQ